MKAFSRGFLFCQVLHLKPRSFNGQLACSHDIIAPMSTKPTFSIISQGCRLNHAETAGLANELTTLGYAEVSLADDPSTVIINTCTVTENGDKDAIKLIRKINDGCTHPNIALIGCLSQIQKESMLAHKNVKWVIGNDQKDQTAFLIANQRYGAHVERFKSSQSFKSPTSFDPKHTRVNVKIQDGCDFYCSFCIIPFARGPARSREFKNIMDDVAGLVHLGVKELVLTGINLGTYSCDGHDFYDVLTAILAMNPQTRVRISSIEPTTIDDRLIAIWQDYPNFCRYLHLPIQSGCDHTLQTMRRRYSVSEYDQYVQSVAAAIPDACIGTDVIVGFPGETDEHFNQTYAYLEQSPVHYFHVFSYSERQMAHSRKFDDPVDSATIKARSRLLRDLHQKKWRAFLTTKLQQTIPVLFEQTKGDEWVGTTEHFIKVRVTSDESLKNQRRPVILDSITDNDQVMGRLA